MSRLAKTVVTEREDFVRNLFRENLALTGAEVQTKLKEKFGKMMRPNRIYELKHEVAKTSLGTATTPEVVEPLTPAESAGHLGTSTALTTALAENLGLMSLIKS
jgi:hypothetical protein